MPTYHYVCPTCNHEFEVFQQRMSDGPKTKKCPACGGRSRRQISGGAGFLFKGEGFYVTDYRSEEYRAKSKHESGESSGDAPADGGKGAKPQAKDGSPKGAKKSGESKGSKES